jgi:LmbE family N-acetylglucosaminyl deacetylase
MPEPLTLMAVHAHPDDESSSTGGVLALAGDEGIRTVLVTCTNGELGDGPNHVKPDEEGHDEKEVAKVRLAELKRACDALGVGHLELLGYHDSGMADWRFREREDAFCNIPMEESAGRLVALFELYRPDVVVTYDDNGGYNHPDHLQAHRIAVAATERTGIPSKLYFIARRWSAMQRLRERMAELGIEMGGPPASNPERVKRMQENEKRITTAVDISSVGARKRAALAAHASQLDESWWVRFPEDEVVSFFQEETFIRNLDRTGAPLPETDLFAGLR